MGMKKPFPAFGNGNGRLVFPGMVGNGNSRSPLQYIFSRACFFDAVVGAFFIIVVGSDGFLAVRGIHGLAK